MKDRCVCGCGRRGRHDHHVVYQQELRQIARQRERLPLSAFDGEKPPTFRQLARDRRNIVRMDFSCHAAHHSRAMPLGLRSLPDSVFEFAVELNGPGWAFEYLRRRYSGSDPRLEALLFDSGVARARNA